jgi:hypothetical protein
MEQTLTIVNTMAKITPKCKEGGVQLYEHMTSLVLVVALDIQNIHWTQANELMHPIIFLINLVKNGLRNSIIWLKD